MGNTVNASRREAATPLLRDYSIEMTGKDVGGLREAAAVIPAGTRVNVTYLSGELPEVRVEAARTALALGYQPIPHVSARRLRDHGELEEFLAGMQAAGASERLFVIGGDPTEPEGPFPDALSVIRTGLLEKHGVREVGFAGYPEGHPDIPDAVLWEHLGKKVAEVAERGFAPVIVTQFGFDADRVVEWVREVRARGIAAPIRVGTPGPAGIKRLLGFARRFGIGANAMIVKKYGFSLTNLMGTAGPDRFVEDLAAALSAAELADDVNLHLYAFGGLAATANWADAFARSTERR